MTLAPITPAQAPFFIRSHAWGMWFKDDAKTFTPDIDLAGVFDEATARQFHGQNENVAVPLADYIERLEHRVTELHSRAQRVQTLIDRFKGHCTHLNPRGYGE